MVYVFLANGFEEIEALAPIDIMRRAGLEVRTVGVGGSTIVSSHKVSFNTDITTDKVVLDDDTQLVVLPGGMPGTLNLDADAVVKKAVSFCAENDRFVGAICAAPSILGHMGLLKGRVATCFPGFETELAGAKYTAGAVEQDGRFITARGAGVCIEFGLKLVEVLCGAEKSASLKKSLQCV